MSSLVSLKTLAKKKVLAAAIPLIMASSAQGIEFYAAGVDATLDSKISLGQSWRMGNASERVTSDANKDDGDEHYDKGDTFSQIFKGSHDLQVTYENYGAFLRGKYWYDAELKNDNALVDSGNHTLAKFSGAEILDAFVYAEFDLFDMPVDLRLGKQVVNWGESTFFGGGINAINPFDKSAVRRPGAEIKEALIPINMAFVGIGITENLSAEAFYLLEFHETVTEGCGTYFSTNDYQAQGCGEVIVSESQGLTVARDPIDIRRPSSHGQFGFALRYMSDALDTEFGLYAMNIHSQLPLVSGNKPVINEAALLGLTGATTESVTFAGTAAALGFTPAQLTSVIALKGDVIGWSNQGFSEIKAQTFYTEYAKNMQVFGLSFATNVATMAISGEVSHKRDVPAQITAQQIINATLIADIYVAQGIDNGDIFLNDYAALEDGTGAENFRKLNISQAKVTAIKSFFQVLGASNYTLIAEAGYDYVHDLDTGAGAIRFGGSVVDANVEYTNYEYQRATTQSAWGYTTRIRGQYTDVLLGVNLRPGLSYTLGVKGYSVNPGGNFKEGNETLGFSLNADYRDTYTASLSYKTYSGISASSDRDFASITMGMTF